MLQPTQCVSSALLKVDVQRKIENFLNIIKATVERHFDSSVRAAETILNPVLWFIIRTVVDLTVFKAVDSATFEAAWAFNGPDPCGFKGGAVNSFKDG